MEPLFHDVTKTKPSHHQQSNQIARAEKPTWPSSASGVLLAKEVQASGANDETKARLVREIIEYEASHGSCTKTFTRKVKKQIR